MLERSTKCLILSWFDAWRRCLTRQYCCVFTVQKILFESGKAVGVSVTKGQQEAVDIYAPIIISNAGVLNTQTMVPKEIFSQSRKWKMMTQP